MEPNNTLAKLALEYNKREQLPWFRTINAVMKLIGCDNLLSNPIAPEINVVELLTKKLLEISHRSWSTALKSNKKLSFYRSFKKSLDFEAYLDYVTFYKDRKLFTKFRCSNHLLEIEKGRHHNVSKGNRICKMCNKQVETEKHYLLFCPKLNKVREKDFAAMWFIYINSKEPKLTYKLVNFVRKAETIRRAHI